MQALTSKKSRLIWIFFPLLVLGACVKPVQRMDRQAQRLGFVRQVVSGAGFAHVVYWKRGKDAAGILHVYLGGDGTPWRNRFTIAADPTPRNPIVLELMAQDGAPSLYLGRPCYHGLVRIPPCNPLLWTARRYGPEVVNSMKTALERVLKRAADEERAFRGIVFIGYSGGGALAMLLAERFERTRGVITIAGNLDIDRWAVWHGYTPLRGSLNPALRPPLKPHIAQLHLAGDQDENMPPELIQPMVSRQFCAEFVVIRSFSHTCCWQTNWIIMFDKFKQIVCEKNLSTENTL